MTLKQIVAAIWARLPSVVDVQCSELPDGSWRAYATTPTTVLEGRGPSEAAAYAVVLDAVMQLNSDGRVSLQ